VADDGTVYVVDGSNGRIQYFTGEGEYLGQWGGIGDGDGQFFGPENVAISGSGTVYVTDYGNYRVQYFTRDGEYLGQWGSKGTGAGEFDLPVAVAIDRQGTVFVSDLYNRRIQYFSPDGQYLGEWEIQPNTSGASDEGPHGLGVGPDGTVYCANYFEGRVENYTVTGDYLGVVSISSADGEPGFPQSVAFNDDGTMYVVDAEAVQVRDVTPKPDEAPSESAVPDTAAPEITVPANMVVPAADASGALVAFDVSAHDAVDGAVDAVADPAAGMRFPVGTTTVVVTARDSSGNVATAEFSVTVTPLTAEPSSVTTSSGEETASAPPPDGDDDSLSKSPLRNPLLWVPLLAVTAFVTTRRKRFLVMLGIGGLLAIVLLLGA